MAAGGLVLRDRPVTLKSGLESTVYLDLRRVFGAPEAKLCLASLLLPRAADLDVEAVGGVVAGGVPLSEAVSSYSLLAGRPLPSFYVRPQPKEHGLARRVDGLLPTGARCLLVEDVFTLGGSALAALDAVREAGGRVVRTVAVVDRSFGAATDAFAGAGTEAEALFTLADFLDAERLAAEQARMAAFRQRGAAPADPG